MKRNSLNLLCVFVVGAMFVAAFAPVGFIGAAPGQQHNIYGLDGQSGADVGGATSISAGSRITGWIDGVSFGLNTTTTADPSLFDLYVDGDYWGGDPYDWVKEGGYAGDTIQYWLDYDPTDYYLQISDFTSSFEEGGYENESSLFFDTQTNTDSILGDTYLRGLKINEIVFDPWLYVYIYDPGGDLDVAALTDAAKGYYIETDDSINHDMNGYKFEFSSYPNDIIVAGDPNFYYVNISKDASFVLNSAEDELKLVWKNPGTSADDIANGTDVIVDRVEWGNFENQHAGDYSWRDHDNTTLSDIDGGVPPSGWGFRLDVNGTDNDDPFNDWGIYTRTPWPIPDIDNMPGAPTELRVHKNANGNDLDLEWLAPTVDYGYLVKNIVYYDSDLSDGFQYTSFQLFDPANSGAGTPDGATLTGMLADGNNYAFIVHTTGDAFQGGVNENPTGTNVGYKYGITLLQNVGKSSQLVVSVPYHNDWTMASDITGAGTEFTDNSIIDTISKWNYNLQTWDSRSWNGLFMWWEDDFAVNPGDALVVTITTTSPYTWKLVGAYDDTFEFVFLQNVGKSSQIFTSLPYHKSYAMASDVTGPGTEFTDNSLVDTVSQWNYNAQTWDSRSWNGLFMWWEDEFTIFASPGDHLVFTITTTSPYNWQPQVIGL